VELHQPQGTISVSADTLTLVEEMLRPVRARHVVYSCGVGDRDPVELPDGLLALARAADTATIEVLFHDFLPISPSYCLLDNLGWFQGVPPHDTTEAAHQALRPDNRVVSHADWRIAWGRLMAAADTVHVFSQDSRRHVATAYPACAERIIVRPHVPTRDIPQLSAPSGGPRVIGVLGGINQQKGAEVLVKLSRSLARQDNARLVLVGQVDPVYTLDLSAVIHGRYSVNEIASLATRYGITDWLIPSIWPETFSYATHEALATGLPVWCFNLGAQAEAVATAPNGHIVPLPDVPDQICPQLLKALFAEDAIADRHPSLTVTRSRAG
jgi:glycosyltransferase involved in cell wall biosynthesis